MTCNDPYERNPMRMPVREIRDSELRLEVIRDQIQMLSNPATKIEPLDYLKLQFRIEENNVQRLKLQGISQ